MITKRPINKREAKIYDEYTKGGWEVFHKGFPDFLLYKNGEIRFIEVKRKQKRITKKGGLSPHQRRVKEILEQKFSYEVKYIA